MAIGSEKLRAETVKALSTGPAPQSDDRRARLERLAGTFVRTIAAVVADLVRADAEYLEMIWGLPVLVRLPPEQIFCRHNGHASSFRSAVSAMHSPGSSLTPT
jgi:hypothetical protein